MLTTKQIISQKIKDYAKELGFDLVGITSSQPLKIDFYQSWIEKGFAGEMEYLKRNIDKRENPELLFEGTKSIVCLGFNYYTESIQADYKVAKYAIGDDYHFFLKDLITKLLIYLKSFIPELEGKVYVDTAPVLERALAQRSGLGWIGKNTLIINPNKGSYFLLGELFLNLELEYDQPIRDYCGNCNKCISACPTQAIIKAGELNSNLCISYLTIESKTEIPDNLAEKFENNIFGCDICQDVCPWNIKFAQASDILEIQPREWLKEKTIDELLELSQEEFSKLFKNSPIKRSKLKGFLRNVIAMISSSKNPKYLPILEKLSIHDEEMVRNQALKAIDKIA